MERGLKEAQELLVSHARGLAGCINHAKVEKTLRKIGFWTRSIDDSDIKGLPDDADKLGECVMDHEKFVFIQNRSLFVLVNYKCPKKNQNSGANFHQAKRNESKRGDKKA